MTDDKLIKDVDIMDIMMDIETWTRGFIFYQVTFSLQAVHFNSCYSEVLCYFTVMVYMQVSVFIEGFEPKWDVSELRSANNLATVGTNKEIALYNVHSWCAEREMIHKLGPRGRDTIRQFLIIKPH